VRRIRTRAELRAYASGAQRPQAIYFPHWSWLIPASVYESVECVMFHMTDLPYGRGGSPLQNLILRGHTQTVLTAFRCDSGIDTGPVYDKRPLTLAGTAEQILARAAGLTADMIVELARALPQPTPQVGEVTVFARRKPDQGNLSQCASVASVYDFVRMLDATGYPPAFLEAGALRLEFSESRLGEDYVDARVRIRMKADV
jgi:methionyl-tRNA formyltransferase